MSESSPVFLTRESVDFLHADSLARYGGMAGARDDGLVNSAIAAAENTFFYGGGDLFDIAAAYAFHLSQAQAFFDGNKRTAVATAFAFLELNGITVTRDDGSIYDALIAIAERRMTKPELAALFRRLFLQEGASPHAP
jgi:death on curing protein